MAGTLRFRCYRSTGDFVTAVNIGKLPRIRINLIVSRVVRGRISDHCVGVVCPTFALPRYQPVGRGVPARLLERRHRCTAIAVALQATVSQRKDMITKHKPPGARVDRTVHATVSQRKDMITKNQYTPSEVLDHSAGDSVDAGGAHQGETQQGGDVAGSSAGAGERNDAGGALQQQDGDVAGRSASAGLGKRQRVCDPRRRPEKFCELACDCGLPCSLRNRAHLYGVKQRCAPTPANDNELLWSPKTASHFTRSYSRLGHNQCPQPQLQCSPAHVWQTALGQCLKSSTQCSSRNDQILLAQAQQAQDTSTPCPALKAPADGCPEVSEHPTQLRTFRGTRVASGELGPLLNRCWASISHTTLQLLVSDQIPSL